MDSHANLKNCEMQKAGLKGADLSGCDLSGCDMREADVSGAILKGANLEGANLAGANLEGVNWEGARLQGALGGRTTSVKVDPGSNNNLSSTLKVDKPVVFALEPAAMSLRAVSLQNNVSNDYCARRMEVLTGPAHEGPWTSVLQFTSQQTNSQQTFPAADNALALSGFVKVVVHDTYGGGAHVHSMTLEGGAFG